MRTAVLALALLPLVCSSLLADAPAPPDAAVVNPWVSTDRSVDTRTVDTILKSLITKDMTDEQKVLAVFHWVRRVIYHGDGPIDMSYNFDTMIHSLGTGSCLRQTTPIWVLLNKAGYKCRTGATGGHHIMEVEYGGKWHLFDPHMNFYVYDRAKPPSIISIEDIKADPALVTDAVKEDRACPGFLLCGDDVSTFSNYSAFKIVGDFPESKKYTPVVKEPFCQFNLRRGETMVRTWMPGPYWFYKSSHKKDEGPRHGCGGRDAKDTVNLPIYEPHVAGRTYRHWGAGYMVYKPNLATDHYLDAVVSRKNVTAGKKGGVAGLVTEKPGENGEIVFGLDSPYILAAGEFRYSRIGMGDMAAAVSVDQGKTWKPLEKWNVGEQLSTTFVDEINGSVQGYWLKLTIPAAGGVANIELKTHFQLVPFALPYLVPGKNVVSVA
ncbi:MAG: hypothetical protein PHU85_12655, partial [Phycisphaerae bacterium]|nr:hypothetical protein [Phycisphaerae bacterium]